MPVSVGVLVYIVLGVSVSKGTRCYGSSRSGGCSGHALRVRISGKVRVRVWIRVGVGVMELMVEDSTLGGAFICWL